MTDVDQTKVTDRNPRRHRSVSRRRSCLRLSGPTQHRFPRSARRDFACDVRDGGLEHGDEVVDDRERSDSRRLKIQQVSRALPYVRIVADALVVDYRCLVTTDCSSAEIHRCMSTMAKTVVKPFDVTSRTSFRASPSRSASMRTMNTPRTTRAVARSRCTNHLQRRNLRRLWPWGIISARRHSLRPCNPTRRQEISLKQPGIASLPSASSTITGSRGQRPARMSQAFVPWPKERY
jgi:hypothetical protein